MDDKLVVMLLIEVLILLSPLFFTLADLWSGVRKAKQRKESITSKKYRRTFSKLSKYYNVLLALGLIDALQIAGLWYMDTYEGWGVALFPWLTLLGSVGVGFVETKSIMEPADKKEEQELKQITDLAKSIVENRSNPDEIAKAIVDYMKSESK